MMAMTVGLDNFSKFCFDDSKTVSGKREEGRRGNNNSDEEEEGRSKTMRDAREEEEANGNSEEKRRGGKSNCSSRSPGSSCQALKHAVSALTRLDDFICERLGSGFFSEVYKVTHRMTGQVMVLKMNTLFSNRPNMLREVQLMNRLSHPNILKFMGVCVHEGQLHALTEYINGGSLEDVLANKDIELPWTIRIKLTLDIARGMCYFHSRGVFHRDLTSKNILIKQEAEDNFTAVVGDFGLATKIPDPLLTNCCLPIVGSPYWMAPEVLKEFPYNEKADVFSFGIIMCEITARIYADPDVLPRTQIFGLDYIAFCEKVDYCPLDFLQLAFHCCQIDPLKRQPFVEIVEHLQVIMNDLCDNDEDEAFKNHAICKRSRSEDNILDSCADSENVIDEEPQMTPQVIGENMSKTDPFYIPAQSNPFATLRFKDGRKVVGKHKDSNCVNFDLPSPSSPFTPPCTPITPETPTTAQKCLRRCQSLPASPNLLRKAAERFHKQSIHGSSFRGPRMSITSLADRSKSALFADCLSWKLRSDCQESIIVPYDELGDSAIDLKSPVSECDHSKLASRRKTYHARQRSVECSLLFASDGSERESSVTRSDYDCLDLSLSPPEKVPVGSDQGFRSASSESFMSIDEAVVSPSTSVSSFNEAELTEECYGSHQKSPSFPRVTNTSRPTCKVAAETTVDAVAKSCRK